MLGAGWAHSLFHCCCKCAGVRLVGSQYPCGAPDLLCTQGNLPLTASACTGYYTSGLLGYQLIHYLAHTRWVPKAPLLRSLRRHHQLHHLRNYVSRRGHRIPQCWGMYLEHSLYEVKLSSYQCCSPEECVITWTDVG
jgi:hypothetical protein